MSIVFYQFEYRKDEYLTMLNGRMPLRLSCIIGIRKRFAYLMTEKLLHIG